MTRQLTGPTRFCILAFLAMPWGICLPGCSQQESTSASSANASNSGATAQAEPTPTPAQPSPTAMHGSSPPTQTQTVATPAQSESGGDPRQVAEDLIYAQIRIKMEDMIASRAAMLKAGKNPSDVEIRQLEGSIMRARELLMENGEKVEDVQPPIVQTAP